jgi:hypothetical protein
VSIFTLALLSILHLAVTVARWRCGGGRAVAVRRRSRGGGAEEDPIEIGR